MGLKWKALPSMITGKKKAFTLVELLVVISIIALLLSILMPSLRKARAQAHRAVCMSNLRSYGLAGSMYISDNDDGFPDPWQSIYDSCQGRLGCSPGWCRYTNHQAFAGETNRYCRWHNAEYSLGSHPEYAGPMWPYLQMEGVNLCPIFKKLSKRIGAQHPVHNPGIPIEPQFGYSQNAYRGGTNYRYAELFGSGAKLGQVRRPSRTVFFAEENMWLINRSTGYSENLSAAVLNDTALLPRAEPTNPLNYEDCFATFHSPRGGNYNEGSSNAVILDNSVVSVRPQDNGTFKMAWPK